MLNASDITVKYGRIEAVKGVNLRVEDGEIVALVGANGAGKTSILGALAGVLPATGSIELHGNDISRAAPHRRVGAGLTLVPEGRGVLAGMSVRENLLLGGYVNRRSGDLESRIEDVLDRFPQLRERLDLAAGSLSGGEQQMLALGRALVGQPSLLALDEPSLGLAPKLVREVLSIVGELRDEGITVLLVEQNVRQALQIADRAYVLQTGKITLEGPAAELLHDREVSEAFLGAEVEKADHVEPSPAATSVDVREP